MPRSIPALSAPSALIYPVFSSSSKTSKSSKAPVDASKQPKARIVRRKSGQREVITSVEQKKRFLKPMGLCPYSLRPMFEVGGAAQQRRLLLQDMTGKEVKGCLEVLFPGQKPVKDNSILLKFSTKTFEYKQFRTEIERILKQTGRRFHPQTIKKIAIELARSADRVSMDHVLPQAWINDNPVIYKHCAQNLLVTSTDENQERGDNPILSCGKKRINDIKVNIRPIALSWYLSNYLSGLLASQRSYTAVTPFVDLISRFTSDKETTQKETAVLGDLVTTIGDQPPTSQFYLRAPITKDKVEAVSHFFTTCFNAAKGLWKKEELQELAKRTKQSSPEFTIGLKEAMAKSRL